MYPPPRKQHPGRWQQEGTSSVPAEPFRTPDDITLHSGRLTVTHQMGVTARTCALATVTRDGAGARTTAVTQRGGVKSPECERKSKIASVS